MGQQILGSDKIVRIGTFPLLGGLQSFDWAPAFNSEDIFELGRTDKVATAQELETSGSFEVTSVGGTAGILARMIVRRSGGAFQGYLFHKPITSGTATAGTTTTLTDSGATFDTDGVVVGDQLVITGGSAAGETRTVTAVTATQLTVGTAFSTAIDATSDYTVQKGNNNYTITQADLSECAFDLVMHEKSDQQNYDRAVVLPRVYLTSYSGRAQANGSASETFNFGGDFVIGAPSPYHAVQAMPATRTTSTTATLEDVAVTSSTHGLMYFYIDERRLRTTNTDAQYATLGLAGVITVTGMTIPATAAMRAIIWDNTSPTSTFPTLAASDRATSAYYVRGYQANIYLAPADVNSPTTSEQWLKVQSIDWNIDLRTEALRQIAFNGAGTSIYCRLPTYPFTISANLSVIESDWADWKAVLDPTQKPFGGTGTDAYGETYDFSPISMKDTFAVVIEYKTKTGTTLQTMKLTDMKVDGYGARVNVGGRSEISWTLRGTAFQLVGANA